LFYFYDKIRPIKNNSISIFYKNDPNPLIKLEGKITTVVYINVIETYLLSYVDTLENKKNCIFWENNILIYIVKLVKNWKRKNDINNFF